MIGNQTEESMNAFLANVQGDIEFDPTVVSIDPEGSLPETYMGTFGIPGQEPIRAKGTKIPPDYRPKYKIKPEFYVKLYAYGHVQSWTVRVIRDLENIKIKSKIAIDPSQTKENKTKAGSIDRDIDLLFSDAHHWYDVILSTGFSKTVRKEVRRNLDNNLRESIQHLRNIKGHWPKNQLYFFGKKLIENRDTRSVKWFLENFPNADPWVLVYPRGDKEEPLISGVFSASRMENEVRKTIRIIEINVNEQVLLGPIKSKR